MRTGEFSQGESDNPTDEGRQSKTENDGGSRQFDGGSGSEQQTGPDGAADGDHGHLSGAELVAKAGFGLGTR